MYATDVAKIEAMVAERFVKAEYMLTPHRIGGTGGATNTDLAILARVVRDQERRIVELELKLRELTD